MNATRKAEALAGVLFIIATLTFMIGNGLIGSIINEPNYLTLAYPNKTKLIVGGLLELINSMAVVGIAVALFPSLKRSNEGIALGYIGFRVVESVILIVGVIFALGLIPLSQDYLNLDGNPSLQALGDAMITGYSTSFQIAMIVLSLFSLIFCFLLYQKALTPRYLAIFGLIGYGCLFVSALSEVLGYSLGMWLYLPGAVFEIVFPIRLIIKGLDKPAVEAGYSQPIPNLSTY